MILLLLLTLLNCSNTSSAQNQDRQAQDLPEVEEESSPKQNGKVENMEGDNEFIDESSRNSSSSAFPSSTTPESISSSLSSSSDGLVILSRDLLSPGNSTASSESFEIINPIN